VADASLDAFGFWAAIAATSLRTGQPRRLVISPSAAHLLMMARVRKAQEAATDPEGAK
jgi:hypothetical protein